MNCIQLAEILNIKKVATNKYVCFNTQGHSHGDKNPSLLIYESGFTCMACGVNGNEVDLVKSIKNVDNQEAYNYLSSIGFDGYYKPEEKKEDNKEEKLKIQLRLIGKDLNQRFLAMEREKLVVRYPNDTDIYSIKSCLNKEYSISTFKKMGVGISEKPYAIAFKDAGRSLVFNPNNHKIYLHVEGRTDYLTAGEMGLENHYGIISDFNKTKKDLSLPGEHYFILDSDDTGYELKSQCKTKKIKIMHLPNSFKDLSDAYHDADWQEKIKYFIVDYFSDCPYLEENDDEIYGENEFFTINDKGRAVVDYEKYKKWVSKKGFYLIDYNNTQMFVYKNPRYKILKIVEKKKLRAFFLTEVEKTATKAQMGVLLDPRSHCKTQYADLSFAEFKFKETNAETDFLYFKDKWLEITKAGIIYHDYSELDSFIFENQIIQHNAPNGNADDKSAWNVFISDVMNNDQKRIKALKSAIGYLACEYKDPSLIPAIVFCDEKLSMNADGRTGKSLVANSLKYIVRGFNIVNGKMFQSNNRFALQSLTESTRIIHFDDANRKFDFEGLFSFLSNSYEIEKKGEASFINDKIKTVITTNYSIAGTGSSFEGRRKEYEFSEYYSDVNTPKMKFGKNFFIDWNEEEWNQFYLWALDCFMIFKKEGLLCEKTKNASYKRLIDSTCLEFVDYMEDFFEGDIKQWIPYSELYENFKNESNVNISRNKFSYWLNAYGNVKKLKFEKKRDHEGKVYLTVIKLDGEEEEVEDPKVKQKEIKKAKEEKEFVFGESTGEEEIVMWQEENVDPDVFSIFNDREETVSEEKQEKRYAPISFDSDVVAIPEEDPFVPGHEYSTVKPELKVNRTPDPIFLRDPDARTEIGGLTNREKDEKYGHSGIDIKKEYFTELEIRAREKNIVFTEGANKKNVESIMEIFNGKNENLNKD